MRRHPHLYEISAWPWLDRLSREHGRELTLADVPPGVWGAIAERGMDAVYLMGVWRRSAIGRLMARSDPGLFQRYDRALPGWAMSDVPGSPYCISAYEPDPRMGGWRGLDAAREAIAARGMALLLDFVPNHTGFDHPWIAANPEFYVQGSVDRYRAAPDLFHPIDEGQNVRFVACGRDPYFPPWRDVAQLNYFNPALREAMIGELATIAQHCDGVRCDMAMLALNDVFQSTWAERADLLWGRPAEDAEFWPEATRRVPMVYLAEVYWDLEYRLQQQGFHFTYDKRLLDRMRGGDSHGVRGHLHADPAFGAKLARFLENHDEERSAGAFGRRFRAAAAIAFTAPGMRFFYDGQFDGAEVHPPVQLGRWPAESGHDDVRAFYAQLLKTIDAPLFHDGESAVVDVQDAGDGSRGRLVACTWRLGPHLALVIANVTDGDAQGIVRADGLPDGQVHVRLGPGDVHMSQH